MHVHLTDGEEVGPTVYAEAVRGSPTVWMGEGATEAMARLAVAQVLDDLSSV